MGTKRLVTKFVPLPALMQLAISCAVAEASAFQVDQWSLESAVIGTWPNIDADGTETVSNPLQTTHFAQVGSSTATTTLDFVWNNNFGEFLVEATHRAAAVDPTALSSVSEGVITISTSTEVLFSVDASYTYYLPVTFMAADIAFQIIDNQDPKGQIFSDGRAADTALGAPLGGTFGFQGQALLPAGTSLRMRYFMGLYASGQSGAIATGDGYFHFTLSEVPEPAAFLSLVLGALLLRQRRRHRRLARRTVARSNR